MSHSRFDFAAFEKLRSIDLGLFCLMPEIEEALDDSFVEYFRTKASSFDLEHLEYGLFLLGKLHTEKARRELLHYIDHSGTSARYIAISYVTEFEELSPDEIKRIRKVIETHGSLIGVRNLAEVLVRKCPTPRNKGTGNGIIKWIKSLLHG